MAIKKITAGAATGADASRRRMLGTAVAGSAAAVVGTAAAAVAQISASPAPIAGATTRGTFTPGFLGLVNSYDHGLDLTAADNKSAIDATIAAAVSTGRRPWFPAGAIYTSGSHSVPASCPPIDGDGAIFHSAGGVDCLLFESGNHQFGHRIGGFVGFSGRAVVLTDANLLGLTIGQITTGNIGISVEVVSGTALDNTIRFGSISRCSGSAIRFYSALTNSIFQGNDMRGNFLTANASALDFNLVATNACDLNYFEFDAIDGFNGVSRGVNGTGIISSNVGACGKSIFKINGYFGHITGMAFQVSNNTILEASLQGNFTASQFPLTGVGIIVKNMFARSNQESALMAVTSHADSARFNGGVPLFSMEQAISLPVPALRSGQTFDFYVFHAFTSGYTQMFHAVPRFNQPLTIVAVEDISVLTGVDGNTAANCVHIRVLALGTVTAATQEISLKYAGG